MVKIYYDLIKINMWNINKVPDIWREDVQTLLDADNQSQK